MPFFLYQGQIHVFHHVPKAAGMTVEAWLADRFGSIALVQNGYYAVPPRLRWSRSSPQHIAVQDLERIIPNDMIASSFAIVRHPVDRLVSAFHHATGKGRIPLGLSLSDWFRYYLSLRSWYPFAFDNHLRPQVDFIGETTKVFRLEDGMDAVLGWLEGEYGRAEGQPDPGKRNSSGSGPAGGVDFHEREIPEATIRQMEAFYREDFVRFGYSVSDRPTWVYYQPARPPGAKAFVRMAMFRGGFHARRAYCMMRHGAGRLSRLGGADVWS